MGVLLPTCIMNPEPIWDWPSSVQFLGRYRVEGESSKFRNSVGYITAMNALPCNAMERTQLWRSTVFSNSPCSCCRESAGISRQKFFWLAQSMATNAAHDSSDDIVVQDSDIAFFLSERAGLAPTKTSPESPAGSR